MLRLLAGRRRTTALIIATVMLCCAWSVAIVAGHLGGGVSAVVGFACAMAVLAVFETLLSPVLAPIVNDLAAERLRGRYNGVFILAYTTGFATGPALAGAGLGIGDGTPFFGFLVAAAAATVVGAFVLRRRLPANVDLIEPEVFATPALQPEIA